jgi:hypothetical protein
MNVEARQHLKKLKAYRDSGYASEEGKAWINQLIEETRAERKNSRHGRQLLKLILKLQSIFSLLYPLRKIK